MTSKADREAGSSRWKIEGSAKEMLEQEFLRKRFPSPRSKKRLAEMVRQHTPARHASIDLPCHLQTSNSLSATARDSTSAATCISRYAIAPSGSLPSKLYHEKLTAISSAAGSILQHEFVQAASQ